MPGRIPKLCRHKRSNRAYATDPFTGQEHYFGIWGTPEAQTRYDEWVKKLIDRRKHVASGVPPGSSVSVARLLLDFMAHARSYYRKDGKETTEVSSLQSALAPVNELYGALPADRFGPNELKAVRQWMIESGWSRNNINKQVQRIRRVWRWGVENEIVRTVTLAALESVAGLRRGRSAAPEREPIAPVPLEDVEAALPHLPLAVAALVQIQLHADMRPGEAVIMRPCDIDRSVMPWLFVPYKHKTEHHSRQRRIFLGPKARETLAPWILKCPYEDAWVFPSRARGRHAAKRTHWTVSGYRKAIRLACLDAGVQVWHPNQLRHTQATIIRAAGYGAEGAQAILGHAQLETTEIYAERNEALAKEIAEKLG